MKKILLFVVGSAVAMASFSSAFAEDQSSGCGLGWQVTQRMSLLSSAVRNTTDTFLPNTFSMTSGTSGCARHDIVKNDEKAVEYAVNNYDSLVVEMAEGHGEFLNGFAQALGCGQGVNTQFSTFTQVNYQKILNESSGQVSGDGVGLYRAVRSQMMNSPEFSQCVPSV